MKNKYRIIISILLAFVCTSFLQDVLPPFSRYMIKPQFVLAAYTYFLFRHKLAFGIVAAVICAILGDGLSGSSGVAYLVAVITALVANHYLLKKQLPENSVSCGLIALPLSLIVSILQFVGVAVKSDYIPSFGFVLFKLIITAVLTAIATIIIAEIIYRFDLIVGNKEVVDEELG